MKKILLTLGGFGALFAGIPFFAAFEAHVINVTATIERGTLTVPRELWYGTVFPQEKLDETFDVSLSGSFIDSCSTPVGVQFASSVVSYDQGVRKNGTAVTSDRIDPTKALGAPQSTGTPFDNPVVANSFFSLGFKLPNPPAQDGGWVILGFDDYIVDVPGTDITVFEITGGTSYPEERVRVEIAQTSAGPWHVVSTDGLRDISIDISGAPIPWAKFVRITDVSAIGPFEATADAYDLDAVRATARNELCGDIAYTVRQKPKCGLPVLGSDPVDYSAFAPVSGEDSEGNYLCPDDYVKLPLLCPYLSKHEITTDPGDGEENDSEGISAFHGLPGEWTANTTLQTQVSGLLSQEGNDVSDTWNIDLRVPCFGGNCAQDWPDFVAQESGISEMNPYDYTVNPSLQGELFGCDLWVETVDNT